MCQRVDASIQAIAGHRTANQGGQALKLLLTFVKNVVDAPTDPKFRSINMESNAFKTKLAPIVGSVALLKVRSTPPTQPLSSPPVYVSV